MKTIKVWDIAVRAFHWSLVIAFVVSYITGEENTDVHVISGYIIAGLVAFRVIWGFVGTRYARFSDFVRGPGAVVEHLRSLRSDKPAHYVGHNPAGGWMIIALLLALSATCLSGMQLYAIEEGKGPLATTQSLSLIPAANAHEDRPHNEDDEAGEELWEEIHELSVNLALILIALHIAGVIVASRKHNEPLVKAMITGKKETAE